ncbi:hypothetical protein [Coprobacter secundus]|nr:hypothetical protein [Coprobacter secundus]
MKTQGVFFFLILELLFKHNLTVSFSSDDDISVRAVIVLYFD